MRTGEQGVISGEQVQQQENRRDSDEYRHVQRFRDLADDGEESSKPLLADTEENNDGPKTDSPPKSRIPVANFRYPNKSELKSAENSPKKTDKSQDDLPEYQNIVNEELVNDNLADKVDNLLADRVDNLLEDNGDNPLEDKEKEVEERDQEDVPPPIPSLPVLDGVADGFIALREIKEIPGTLNGLYLWLAQRLFHGRRFSKHCTRRYLASPHDGHAALGMYYTLTATRCVRYISVPPLVRDVQHCTRRYLASPHDGHAALGMYYTLTATRCVRYISVPPLVRDVQHCTRRYLASPHDGHAALGMYYTLTATRCVRYISVPPLVRDVQHCTRCYLASPHDGHAALGMYYTLTATRFLYHN
ncbi:Ankyrin repeat domain-containing protein 50 [Operophtera brumata]|uniref:Ankyrin repeat domain-containing protein 50 n=1 Tax=Operophtera brumata TaxID=104452 RepID=A0A0L7LHP6_OPEBR|nr:Ankyrin repeat domain-containing protein 50 [Operophtera brumata]